MLFSNQDLKKLIVPLFLEQLLVALVGMADGRHRHRPCDVSGLVDTRHHLLVLVPAGQVEEPEGDLKRLVYAGGPL